MRSRRLHIWLQRAVVLLFALVFAVAGAQSAWADETEDDLYSRSDCTITLEMKYKQGTTTKTLSGGEFSLYTVATVKRGERGPVFDVASGKFAKVKDIADIPSMSSKELSETNFSLAKTLEKYAAKVKADKTAKIEDGEVFFGGLKPGLYLIMQTKTSEGNRKITSFLVSIPDEDGNFQIKGAPKPGIETPETEAPPETKTPSKTPSKTKLPQTGQLWWPVPVMGGAGIVLILLGVCLRKRED